MEKTCDQRGSIKENEKKNGNYKQKDIIRQEQLEYLTHSKILKSQGQRLKENNQSN